VTLRQGHRCEPDGVDGGTDDIEAEVAGNVAA
jgi:hypothetical protein